MNIEKDLFLRFIVMGYKSLPDPRKKSRSYWSFVGMVTTKVEDAKAALAGRIEFQISVDSFSALLINIYEIVDNQGIRCRAEENDTSTSGHLRNSPARAVGEGFYHI